MCPTFLRDQFNFLKPKSEAIIINISFTKKVEKWLLLVYIIFVDYAAQMNNYYGAEALKFNYAKHKSLIICNIALMSHQSKKLFGIIKLLRFYK